MRRMCFLLLKICAASLPLAAAADEIGPGRLDVPARDLSVDLQTGEITSKGNAGMCLETVARSGGATLTVSKEPGDDFSKVLVNGQSRPWVAEAAGSARLGSLRLSRQGGLSLLRTWKTGDKQIELLQDGEVVRSWKRGTSVRLLRANAGVFHVMEQRSGENAQLVKYLRSSDPVGDPERVVLVDFGTCRPERLLLRRDEAWAQMQCDGSPDAAIYKIPLATGAIGEPVLDDPGAEFVTLPRTSGLPKGETVAVVSGSASALHFYYAVTGLLLSQTGEARACSSDAEGLQSWNQSYRLRALAALFEKTRASVFSALALKSMRLSLAAQDIRSGNGEAGAPSCGWGSTIYSSEPGSRLHLMINQAMIANALAHGCQALGALCPSVLQADIEDTSHCLANKHEPAFETDTGLYRIEEGADFRFAGTYAPWNWQIAFAELLNRLPDAAMKARATEIVRTFTGEWQSDTNGALWRYWPLAYYTDKGVSEKSIDGLRFEDTGHAGISLLSLRAFADGAAGNLLATVRDRFAYLLSFGRNTPRDLDGKGPRGGRWFPSGGWADYASAGQHRMLAKPLPGRNAADTLYAYARLYDPADDFRLKIDVFVCNDICRKEWSRNYPDWSAFLNNNLFFSLKNTNISHAE